MTSEVNHQLVDAKYVWLERSLRRGDLRRRLMCFEERLQNELRLEVVACCRCESCSVDE